MGLPSLNEIVGEIDICPQEGRAYLNVKSGETYIRIDDLYAGIDEDADEKSLSELERRERDKRREIEGSMDWVRLPPKDDFDEYAIMEDFCGLQKDERLQERLFDAIRGRGAFSRFKRVIYSVGIEDQWYRFKEERLKEAVAEWLQEKKIPYGP